MNKHYLFEFEVGLNRYFYTSAVQDIKRGDVLYKSEIIYPNELGKDSMNDDANISSSIDIEPVTLYKQFNPSVSVNLKVLNESAELLFYGRIGAIEFDLKGGLANIKLSTLGGLMKGKIPTRTYSRECGFELFDRHCGLKSEEFRLTLLGSECEFVDNYMGAISSKIKSKPLGYFKGGYLAFNNQFSYITESLENCVNLMFPLNGLNASSVIHIYAGCDKRLGTCMAKFNNEASYGGFPFVPNKNPMSQGF